MLTGNLGEKAEKRSALDRDIDTRFDPNRFSLCSAVARIESSFGNRDKSFFTKKEGRERERKKESMGETIVEKGRARRFART